jgi:hypothetical protein
VYFCVSHHAIGLKEGTGGIVGGDNGRDVLVTVARMAAGAAL